MKTVFERIYQEIAARVSCIIIGTYIIVAGIIKPTSEFIMKTAFKRIYQEIAARFLCTIIGIYIIIAGIINPKWAADCWNVCNYE
jgi:uncharacterized membrane protein HdeD (DUF308 family)